MKIFFISRGIPSKGDPQWGNFELDQAKGLMKRGHQIVILSVDSRYRFRKRHIGIGYTQIDGIPAYDLCYPLPIPYSSLPVGLQSRFLDFLIDKLFRFVIKKEGTPDIIHAHYLSRIAMGVYLKRKYHIPLVGTEHFSKVLTEVHSEKIRSLGSLAYHEADRIVAVSTFLGKQIKQEFGVECSVIPNAVDTSVFSFSDVSRSENHFTFVTVGNLLPIKGFDLLLEAFSKAKFSPNVSLKIIGGGEQLKYLQQQISELGLTGQVQLTGRLDRSSIASIMERSHAFVMSSRSETFGVVLIEAMTMGLPVVATNCGGTIDIVNSKNGVLIPVEDVDRLSVAMKEMIVDVSKYDRASISNNCKLKFSPESIAERLEMLYNDILNQR